MKQRNEKSEAGAQALSDLLHRHMMGDLTPEEFANLEDAMRSSPELRARYLQAIRMDAWLHEQALEPEQVTPVTRRSNSWMRIAAVAAAVALAALALWKPFSSHPQKTSSTTTLPAIATLVDSRECKWRPGSLSAMVDERLSPGMIELSSGVALIEFDGGARLALTGPGGLELIDAKSARLHYGHASVRCEEGLYTFGLHTPTSTVIDIGTEFGVAVGADGSSEVHVLDGEVEVADAASTGQAGTLFLNTGKTLILASNGSNRMEEGTAREWVRDYTSMADRLAVEIPPRVIARDPFPDTISDTSPFSNGTGWKGAWWRATKERVGEFRVVPMDPMTRRDGSAGTAMKVGSWVEGRRVLTEPIDPTIRQTVYASFWIHRMNPKQRDAQGQLSEAALMLRSSHDPTVLLGMALSGKNHWVVLENGGWERSESPAPAIGPWFVVAKIELNPWLGNKVSMIGFTDFSKIPSAEPAAWDLVSKRNLAKISVPLDVVALQARRSPFKFADVTIGNCWQSVIHPDAVVD